MDKNNIADSRGKPARKAPQNPIIGQKRADKWDTQLDGIIVDLDIIASKAAVIDTRTKGSVQWVLIRDVIVILLLLSLIALTIWRAILTDQRLAGCGNADSGVVSLSIPDKQ